MKMNKGSSGVRVTGKGMVNAHRRRSEGCRRRNKDKDYRFKFGLSWLTVGGGSWKVSEDLKGAPRDC